MRERFNVSKILSMSEKMAEDIQRGATSLKGSFEDVVRECIQNDPPKLKERGNNPEQGIDKNTYLSGFLISFLFR